MGVHVHVDVGLQADAGKRALEAPLALFEVAALDGHGRDDRVELTADGGAVPHDAKAARRIPERIVELPEKVALVGKEIEVEGLVKPRGRALRQAQSPQVEVACGAQVAHALVVLALHVDQQALKRPGKLATLPVLDAVDDRQGSGAVPLESQADGTHILYGARVGRIPCGRHERLEARVDAVHQTSAHLRPDNAPYEKRVACVCGGRLSEKEGGRLLAAQVDVDVCRAFDRSEEVQRVAGHHEVFCVEILAPKLAIGDACPKRQLRDAARTQRQKLFAQKTLERGR